MLDWGWNTKGIGPTSKMISWLISQGLLLSAETTSRIYSKGTPEILAELRGKVDITRKSTRHRILLFIYRYFSYSDLLYAVNVK